SCVLLEGQGGEAPERARDTQSRGRGAEAQPVGDVRVRQLVDYAQLERLALVLRERLQCLRESRVRREPILDSRVAVVRGEIEREPEPAARPRLDLVPPRRLSCDVAGDAEEPRKCRAVGLVAE